MFPPGSSASDLTAVPLSDLERAGKQFTNVTVTTLDAPSERPILGRRKTTNSILGSVHEQKLGYDGEEDALTKIGNVFYRIHSFSIVTRYVLYILPVAGLLAIPLALTDTIYASARAGHVRLVGIFIWIEVIWVGLWICKLISKAIPIIFQAACGIISTGYRKYSLVLTALEIPMSLFLWSILAYGSTNLIDNFIQPGTEASWLSSLSTVFKAGIIVAAIFLAEKTFVQLVAINYHHKQYDAKIKESKKLIRLLDLLYDASRQLFPEYCKEFEVDDAEIQGNTLTDVRERLARAGLQTKIFDDMGRVRDKVTAAFGAMASDISGKQVFSATSAHAVVVEALETERASKALARRLWLSFVGEGRDVLYKHDLVEVLGSSRTGEAEELFAVLDRDGNGDVSLDEMTMLVVGVAEERKNRATSMSDVADAISVLDKLLSVVVLIAIALVYATFFSKAFASKTTQLWTTFTGLAFAIGGTVTEFLACCIFLFVKHPYDVGDRVDITNVQLVVEHISLMYSVFRRIDTDATVQIPHSVANTLWIENVTRSKSMKERYSFSVSVTTSSADILALRGELEKFVQASEHKRDFHDELNIELISVGDLKQLDLRVEIRHKSNFANEQLRQLRRNKFMCELLATMRRIPIDPPGGSDPALGDPTNPSYSVTVSDLDAIAARAKQSAATENARLYPVNLAPSQGLEAVSTALPNPAMDMIATVTGRRGAAAGIGRSSSDSMRISQESRRYGPSVTTAYLQPPMR